MKIFRELIIVFGVYYIGEFCAKVFGLVIPGSLIGMVLLVVLLRFRVVKLEYINSVSDFLLGHLPFFFIPAGVALISVFPIIAKNWIWILLLCVITTFLTMGISGWSLQHFMEKKTK
ncbi:CidA/LrgA family protein [Amedibacillus sp. YH-ame10]